MVKTMKPLNFERELFKLDDGGTIGLDWVEGRPSENSVQPILAITTGFLGTND